MTTTPTPRPVESPEDRMRHATDPNATAFERIGEHAAAIIDQGTRSFRTYLDAQERDQLDARAATAEQERDDALDDLQAVRHERDALRQERERLTRERDEALEARDVLRHQLNTHKAVIQSLNSEVANAHNALRNLAQAYANRESIIDGTRADLAAARAQLAAPLRTAAEHLRLLAEDHAADSLGFGIGWAADTLDAWAKTPDERPTADLGSPAPRAQEPEQAGEIPAWRQLRHARIDDQPMRCRARTADPTGLPHRCFLHRGHTSVHEWKTEREADQLAAEAAQYRWTPDKPAEQIRGEHGPEVPAEQLPAGASIRPGQFCGKHFSWLCQAGQGRCQAEREG